jgi:starch phosphorylase
VFLEDYDIEVGRHLVQGVDVWLNNPRRPLEASGTSGMKAAANGVLNLSVLDGWWDEGYDPEVGWAIGAPEQYPDDRTQDAVEASSLYDLLEREVVPLYYRRDDSGHPREWISRMKASVRQLCWRFNTNRMVSEYADRFYVPAAHSGRARTADDLAGAREVSAWIRRVREAWDGVKVVEVTQEDGDQLLVGEEVPVRARVRLGDLEPADVAVELVHGPLDAADRVQASAACLLALHESGDGEAVYEGTLAPDRSGLYGYGVRVRPLREGVVFPDEFARVAWAGSE